MIQSQENCLSDNHRFYLRAIGRGLGVARFSARMATPVFWGVFLFAPAWRWERLTVYFYKPASILIWGLLCFAMYGRTVSAKGADGDKKAILVVSFGTSYPATRKLTIEAVENKIRAEFPGFTVRRAFTSPTIIKKLRRQENLCIDTPREALEKLGNEGFQEVVVQPLHIIAGQEYDQLKNTVDGYRADHGLAKLVLGKPVLYSAGEADDYGEAVKALAEQLPPLSNDEAVVLMGHGTRHPANIAYTILQQKLDEAGMRVYLGTVEASPTLDDIKARLLSGNVKRVVLMPFMLAAGAHVQNDLAGDGADSWKGQLEKAGYEVSVYMHGLGENPALQNIYLRHVAAAVRQLSGPEAAETEA